MENIRAIFMRETRAFVVEHFAMTSNSIATRLTMFAASFERRG